MAIDATKPVGVEGNEIYVTIAAVEAYREQSKLLL